MATCHILALQVLMRQKGLGLFWKTSWRRGKRLLDQPQHARPWPPKSLQQPSKGREPWEAGGETEAREGGGGADLPRIAWRTGGKVAGVSRLRASALANPAGHYITAGVGT